MNQLPSDNELYNQYLVGNAKAGDQLMLRYANALTLYIDSFIHNLQDAEDLMLDCFSVILIDKPKIANGAFRAYLFRVARNRAFHQWKRKIKQNEFSLSEELESDEHAPDNAMILDERNQTLHRCLNSIAEQYREALWLIYGMELSYEQTAKIMGCNRKRIDNLLVKGKKALRTELEKEGITNANIQ